MIRCENLTAGYGRREVIRNINWAAESGLTAIVGPNGSGKSTLLKSLTGQAAIMGGCAYLDEKPLRRWKSGKMARRIAYLPQSRNDVNLSVFRMVLHGRFPHLAYPRHYGDEDEKMVIQAAERMGIGGLLEKPVSELSGGEKQRAYLAMAMVQDAPILLLDEPATYLDISAQVELMEMLKQLTREGKTVVAVLHDLNHALQYAEEIILMENGRMRGSGTPKEILGTGVLEEVFRVRVHSLRDECGKVHYCFSQ